ncbi:MAG: heavy metal-responsive transcriptional regulator [bacterium]|nr:heavy metal-responsive transcriptional regulator [bacterium]
MERKIGQMAAGMGINRQTLLYYERMGLLNAESRSASGYRYYGEASQLRLRFILKAKGLGFSLQEIRELLNLRAEAQANCDSIRTKAEQKLAEIEGKVAFLIRMQNSLARLVQDCEHRKSSDPCPILATLEENEDETI